MAGDSKVGRRDLERWGVATWLSLLAGCGPRLGSYRPAPLIVPCERTDRGAGEIDYVVVGSGAAGGTLAGNLARAGHSVVLLEAGSDPASWARDVPAFHPRSVEDPNLRWDFFVRTYENESAQRKSDKFLSPRGGVLYPRAGTLGGCTAHNALIMLAPHESDWNAIATLLSDPSWRGESMRRYFERIEHCDYVSRPARGEPNPSRHGFDGWLHTAVANPWLAARDRTLIAIVEAALEVVAEDHQEILVDAFRMAVTPSQALWDPNDYRLVQKESEGVVFVPLHMNNGTRIGTREYVHAVAAQCPSNLRVVLDALATRIIWDGNRAVGIEYLEGRSLYRASPIADPRPNAGIPREIRARREVILCGGVFNSPQLLMLSGVGPREELERHGIEVRIDLAGVGQNLQDRYEIGVVSEMEEDFAVLAGGTVDVPDPLVPDPLLEEWWNKRSGPYATNGIVAAMIKRSSVAEGPPDLFLFGLVGRFRGYYPGFSADLSRDHKHFTWGVLKAHTRNQAGTVKLATTDPRDPPLVDFHYFDEGSPGWEKDVEAVIEGIETVRHVMGSVGGAVRREVTPGAHISTRADLARYVRDNAWGHHASCTNKMGLATDPLAVVDGRFRVHGTEGLRVVDASVFPRIPGFFILSSVYIIAEKATDTILEDAKAPAERAL
jgi:choline dehydrogenase